MSKDQRARLGQFTKLSADITDKYGESHTGAYEIRYNFQSCNLPPSQHPETGRYEWIHSPEDIELAECPEWIIQAIEDSMTKGKTNSKRTSKVLTQDEIDALSEINQLIYYEELEQKEAKQEVTDWDIYKTKIMLEWLIANASDSASISHDDWLGLLMALHSVNYLDDMMVLADEWSRGGSNYEEGCVEAKWDSFDTDGNSTGKKGLGTFVNFAKEWGCEVPNFYTYGREDEDLDNSEFEDSNLELPIVESKLVVKEFFVGEWKDTNNTIPMSSKEPPTSNEYSRWVPTKEYDAERNCTLVWKEQAFNSKLDVGLEIG